MRPDFPWKPARRTAYSLMGAGFHGKSGIKPSIKADMWRNVVPRLIYGLEVHNLRKKDILQLEAFQRRCLKQLQSMPSRTSDTASLALLGMLEKNILNLFGRVARDQSCIENDLAKRQLAVRDPSDKSWFSSVRNILNTYWLPTAYEILEHPPSSEQWKKQVKYQLHTHVEKQWRDDIISKSTLKYLNPEAVKVGKIHPVFATVRNNPYDVNRAKVKARLLTGTYTLQSNREKFNQFNVSPICQLCNKDPETREHFLVTCEALHQLRIELWNKITALFEFSRGISFVLNDPELTTQLLLDSSHQVIERELRPSVHQTNVLEFYSRELIYKLHVNRDQF